MWLAALFFLVFIFIGELQFSTQNDKNTSRAAAEMNSTIEAPASLGSPALSVDHLWGRCVFKPVKFIQTAHFTRLSNVLHEGVVFEKEQPPHSFLGFFVCLRVRCLSYVNAEGVATLRRRFEDVDTKSLAARKVLFVQNE